MRQQLQKLESFQTKVDENLNSVQNDLKLILDKLQGGSCKQKFEKCEMRSLIM